MNLVKPTRKKRVFYAKEVNMNWSFDRLAHLAEKLLGAELDVGDVIVCDNSKQDKRKLLQKTATGYIIFYARKHKGDTFDALADHNGKISLTREVL